MIKDGTNGSKSMISSDEIGFAMREIYDTMIKASLFGLILGDAAYQIKVLGRDGYTDHLQVDHLEWGIPEAAHTAEVKSFFKTWGFTPTDTGYSYMIGKVPIIIRIFKRKYHFLSNFDTVFYGVDEFRIPNQFNKYYKARYILV